MLLNLQLPRKPRGRWNIDRGIVARRHILQAIDQPMTAHEIAQKADLAIKTTYDHLRRLVKAGALIQTQSNPARPSIYSRPTP
jgi:predicted ArsR family transcriptional regulator